MYKIISLVVLLFISVATVTAQDTIATAYDTIAIVFNYSDSNLKTRIGDAINPMRHSIENALYNSGKYIVVDRSKIYQQILRKEFNYQVGGSVNETQLSEIGKQLGVNKLCGVVVSYTAKDGYFIECKILDVKESRVESSAQYPIPGVNKKVKKINYSSSREIAQGIVSQLGLSQRRFIYTPAGFIVSSAVIPGLGLMNKKHQGWGRVFLLSEVGLASGIAITYFKAQNILMTLNDPMVTVDGFSASRARYNQVRTLNNILIESAAAVYVTNLIVTGVLKNKNKDFCFVPVPTFNYEGEVMPSLLFTLNF